MGLFSKSEKFDICPNSEELKFLVTNFIGHNGVLKLNAKLVVPNGFDFVIGKKGKVTDKFCEGEYFINFANLPYTCRRFCIDKVENGKQKDRFIGEGYFVDKTLRAGKFKTYRKVEMGTKAYGIFKAGVFGMFSYKVVNSTEFMQSLLNEFDYIKTGEAEDLVENWVNDLVVGVLEKNNFMLTDVISNSPIIAEKLKQAIGKVFVTAGLEIVDVVIYKYKLPKKYQEASDNNIKLQQEGQKQEEEQTNIEPKEQQSDLVEPEPTKQVTETNATINNYVPFGNFVIGEADNNCKEQENIKEERSFVDLNLDSLYDSEVTNKRCTRCGAENDLNADHCVLCGEKFSEEGDVL